MGRPFGHPVAAGQEGVTRILLAALNAPKGDLDANLASHAAVLEQARVQGCQVAVFPEFSLTGSVDPRRHPERAVTVDAEPVRALLEATSRTGVAAVFGWDDAVAGGASVVCFCSAPGLHGRRTDERGWRDGHAWWLSCGLGDAARHARRLGVPVAMTTQAGATEDEDFPGLAALVSPDGQVARLPDWRPGSLVVEVADDLGG